jgi:hypothetical protein
MAVAKSDLVSATVRTVGDFEIRTLQPPTRKGEPIRFFTTYTCPIGDPGEEKLYLAIGNLQRQGFRL